MTKFEQNQVVIAGIGPVGMVMAIELARQGFRPIMLDSKKALAWSSRAICISRRSLEIFRRIGLSPAFFDKALGWSKGKTFLGDQLVFELNMPSDAGDEFAPFVNIQQYYTEQYLLDTIAALGDAVDIRWGHAVTSATQDEDGAHISVRPDEGEDYRLDCDWLMAADGARSPIREALGLTLKGTSYEGRYMIADIEVAGVERPVERHVWFDPVSNPGSTVILHVQPDGIWRIDIQLDGSQDDAIVLAEDNLVPLIQSHLDMMGVEAEWRVIWKSVYRAHALSLDDYRHDRVLFAGDAAHLVPIFGVRGLNSGVDDAHNLGWKLGAVLRGEADERLLDSYTEERRLATLENLANAAKSTWFMSPPTKGFRIMRDAVLSLAETHEWARPLINPRQSSAHRYTASSIIIYDAATGEEGVSAGAVLPSIPLPGENERWLHAALGTGFTLLIFADAIEDEKCRALLAAAAAKGVTPVLVGGKGKAKVAHVPDPDGRLASRFAPVTHPVYLVRPDEHVAARLPADPAAFSAAMEQALGRVPQSGGGAFIPVESLDRVVPQTEVERLFERLSRAIDNGSAGIDDVQQAKRALLAEYEAMRDTLGAIDAACAHPKRCAPSQ